MSVLLVTDDADDDKSIDSKDNFYKQLKDFDYNFCFTSSSSSSSSSTTSSPSILVQSNQHYRQHRRRRRRCCRSQQCLPQHLLTYIYTLFILINHLHWSVIVFSLSSMKIMSTHASTTISKRPLITPSIKSTTNLIETNNNEQQQCRTLSNSSIDRICSKTCQIGTLPFVSYETRNLFVDEQHFLPFCFNRLSQTIIQENFFNQTNEHECRQTLSKILEGDNKARKATELFATYLQAIDSASEQNRYSIITADCQSAYRIWACSIQIPFYYQNQLIPPCQSICDEVERVCPTFRPSDREPSFAGQPLFFCHGGIVENNDYARRPHCFDSCHLSHGSLQRPSNSKKKSSSNLSIDKFIENLVTTPPCFEIQPYSSSSSSNSTSILSLPAELLFENRTNRTRSSSATRRTISLSFILTFIFLQNILTTKFFEFLIR